jgi:hypothetical protein
MEAPRCEYDKETQILTTPSNAQQESILSNVHSLPFFQDIDAIKQAAGANKKGKKKEHTAPKVCFQIGSASSVQTVHGANDGKYTNVTKPGVELGAGTQASAATKSNAEQPAVEIDSPNDDTSSSEGSKGGVTKRPPLTKRPHPPLVIRMNNPMDRPAADSPLQLPPLHHGGGQSKQKRQVVHVRWLV